MLIGGEFEGQRLIRILAACTFLHCVVPENIHTPTMEGISRKTPSTPEFSFFDHKNNPPPLRYFHEYFEHPPYPLEKIVLARKCVKVKVNTLNT